MSNTSGFGRLSDVSLLSLRLKSKLILDPNSNLYVNDIAGNNVVCETAKVNQDIIICGNTTILGEKLNVTNMCLEGNISGNNNVVTNIKDLVSVSVYTDGEDWIQQGTDIDGEAAGDESGTSVSLSADGNTVAIGANRNDGNGNDAGHTRVYDWNQGSGMWVQRGADIDGEAANDFSGISVSISADGNTVAIGAVGNDGNGSNAGHTRVYDWNVGSGMWIQRGADIDGEAAGDQSGYSVSLSADGNTVAIGASRNHGGNGVFSGHTRVYDWNVGSSMWVQRGTDIDGEAANDESGRSVSLSADGNTVAIGAFRNDGNGFSSGHTRVYDWNTGSGMWVQRGADIDGEAANDESGYSVSLSADGNIVAIGAYSNNGNGSYSGHTRVYDWNTGSGMWVQRGADIDGEAANDLSGWSVSLSADGNIVAIGALFNDGNGSDAGHTRVYDWNVGCGMWVQRGTDIDGEAADDLSGVSVSLSADGNTVAIGALEGGPGYYGVTRVYRLAKYQYPVEGTDLMCGNITNVKDLYVDTIYPKSGVSSVNFPRDVTVTGKVIASYMCANKGTITDARIQDLYLSGNITSDVVAISNVTVCGTLLADFIIGKTANVSVAYVPAMPGNWGTTVPTTISEALDLIVAALGPLPLP